MLSTLFQTILAFLGKSSLFFVFFRFFPQRTAVNLAAERGLLSLRVEVGRGEGYKPNSKGIFMQCPYSDKRRFSSLKPSAPKNKPFQTICFAPSPSEAFGEVCCHFAPKGVGVRSTNRIQREFDSNGGIAPFDHLLASSHPRQRTNLFKQFVLLPLPAKRGGLLSLRAAEKGLGVGIAPPNQKAQKNFYPSAPLFLCVKP
jgi:hypothetical protein